MPLHALFPQIVRRDIPLSLYTRLQLGGTAEFFAEPNNEDELLLLLKEAGTRHIPVHILGSGSSLLVPEAGVSGLVISLAQPDFCRISVDGDRLTAGGGTPLGQVVTHAVSQGLGGIEGLVGMPGSFGGAVCCNLGTSQGGDIGEWVESIRVVQFAEQAGGNPKIATLSRTDAAFAYRHSNLQGTVFLAATLKLEREDAKELAKRMRKTWIIRKSQQPVGEAISIFAFKNPEMGASAAELIERVGLRGTKIGGAEISERNPGFITVNSDGISDDVLRLIRLVQEQVALHTEIDLQPALEVW